MDNTNKTNQPKEQGKQISGVVVGLPTKNTAMVEVMRVRQHPIYRKSIRRKRRFAVHVEGIDVAIGAMVVIRETRPISKRKHFEITKKMSA